MMAKELSATATILNGIVLTGLYTRLGRPWWPGIAALFAVAIAAFFLVPDALLLLAGLVIALAGGALFGYRRQSYWWAVAAVVVAGLVSAVIITISEGWDVGPAADVIGTIFLGLYLAGATMLGGVLGRRLASPPTSR